MRGAQSGGWTRWIAVTTALVLGSSVMVLAVHGDSRASAAPAAAEAVSPYSHVLSSGAFALPAGAKALDWIVVNDSPNPQQVRVTVYKVLIGSAKTAVPPGAITATVAPNTATHNANNVGTTFTIGANYEIVVETNDQRVLPSVDVWSTTGAVVIPGTHLSPRDFSEVR